MNSNPITLKSLDDVASSIVAAAFTPDVADINGKFWKVCQPGETKDSAPWTKGDDNADKLWVMSERMAGQKFSF